MAAWKPVGLGWMGFCCKEGVVAAGDVGDVMVLEEGVGVIDVKPTIPFRLAP